MENRASSSVASLGAESAQIVKIFLLRHSLAGDQEGHPETRSVDWGSSEDFTVEKGKRQIGEYIRTWELPPRWLFGLDFLCTTEEQHHNFHHYRARFSTPTPRKPIQGTASVYFVMCESRVEGRDRPVEVGFVVESNRLVHTPGATWFTEKWLSDVIEDKAALRRAPETAGSAPRATSSEHALTKTKTQLQ